jgi:hypothetical protein
MSDKKSSSPLLSAHHTLSTIAKSLATQVIEFARDISTPKTRVFAVVRIPVRRADRARYQ